MIQLRRLGPMDRLYKGEIGLATGVTLRSKAPLPLQLHPLRSSLLVILEALMQVEEVASNSTEVREGAKVHCRKIFSSLRVYLSFRALRYDLKYKGDRVIKEENVPN